MSKTGGCLCGAVRYELHGTLRKILACHCLQCRKTSGHYWAATSLPSDQLTLLEDKGLKWFASSDQAKRGFCQECGASLFWRWHGSPTISVAAGSVDGNTDNYIAAHIFTDFQGDYYALPADIPAYGLYDDQGPEAHT